MRPEDEWRERLLALREEKDRSFRESNDSPIPFDLRQGFEGLDYYPPDPAYRFDVQLEPAASDDPVKAQTSTGEAREYRPAGTFEFEVDGTPCTLTALKLGPGHALFIPFKDATSGRETYGGGRYLELPGVVGDAYTLDFNLAYNPFCAYDEDWSCPLPPPENRLRVPIRAGEKRYEPW